MLYKTDKKLFFFSSTINKIINLMRTHLKSHSQSWKFNSRNKKNLKTEKSSIPMELCVFAPDDGYAEAIIRGLRASFLSEAHYNQMKNCSTLAELKSVLFFFPSYFHVFIFFCVLPTR